MKSLNKLSMLFIRSFQAPLIIVKEPYDHQVDHSKSACDLGVDHGINFPLSESF